MQTLALPVALLLASLSCRAQLPANLLDRLQAANAMTRLTGPDTKPWHLKMSFDLQDEPAGHVETGALEEWWAAPDRFRIVITSPSYTATEISNGDQLFRSRGQARPPRLLEALLQQATHPLPEPSFVRQTRPLLQQNQLGPVSLDCIILGNDPVQGRATPFGLFPTYCFEVGSLTLRVSYSEGTRIVIRNHAARFQEQAIDAEIVVKDRDVIVLRGKVERLEPYTPAPADFTPTSAENPVDDPVEASAAEMMKLRLRNTFPSFPRAALEDHRIGVVIVRALIGKDGLVHSVVPVYSPDKRLTEASLDAVRQWTFQPLKRNGRTRDVETTFTISFNLL